MRAVVTADIHCHAHEQFATTLPGGRNSRFQNILDVLKEMTEFCRREDVNVVFVLGDIFHSRTKIDVDVFSATWCAFRDLRSAVDEVFIITGNHDQNSKDGRIHSLEAFRAFATVIDQPVIDYVTTWDARIKFAAHPFTTDMDSWNKFVDMIPNVDFFLFHQGVVEATTGAFDISVKAEVRYTDLPIGKAKWCLGGHYHKQQWLGEEKRAGYPGSPLQHGFPERLEEKGFLFFDGVNKRPKFIRTSAPRFVLYGSPKAFYSAETRVGDFVRVAGCTPEEAQKIKDEFPNVQVEIERREQFEENRITADVASSDEALLQAYIEKEATNGIDRSRLLQFGMEILTEEE